MDGLISWLVRFAHILGAVYWVGTFAFLGMIVLPRLARGEPGAALQGITAAASRTLNWAGILTILAGLVLIWRSRGYASLFGSEWGGLLLVSILVALGMLALGAGTLKRLLSRAEAMTAEEASRAGRLATMGTGAGVLVLALMTRMVYAAG